MFQVGARGMKVDRILYTISKTLWTVDQPVARPLPTHRTAQTQNKRIQTIFFYLVCEAIGTAATPGLFCQPRVIVKMTVEKQMECRMPGETEVLGENLPPAPLLSITESHMTRPGFEPGTPRWEAGDYFFLFYLFGL
jgi:hypothetical protein